MRKIDCPKYSECLDVAAKKDKAMPCGSDKCPVGQVVESPKPIIYPVAKVKVVRDSLLKKRAELDANIGLLNQYLEAVGKYKQLGK